jgi:RHS repeat-associated protein
VGSLQYNDFGSVSITVNGYTDSTSYGQGDTATSVAAGLAQAINGDPSAFVNASASNGVLYLTARQLGAATNYSWQLSATSYDTNGLFDPNGSFANPPSSGTLSGGQDANPGTTVYDSGTCSVTINGTSYSTSFGQGDTTSSIASRLASNISGGGLATASASSGTISLTAKSTGATSNYSLSSTCSYNSSYFSSPSFSASGSGSSLTGGSNGSPAATDAGTVQMSIAGYSATKNYGNGTGQDSTASAVASDLTSKIQSQLPSSSPPFTISVSDAAITVQWNSVGAAGNVTVSTTSTTTQTSSFSVPSFASCAITSNPQNCSTALSGGQDPYSSGLAHPFVTLYTYDGLGNLTCVEQHGDASSGTGCSANPGSDATSPWRVRRFTYDSLSRLLTAKNPESGTISYSYDANSNLLQKTSPAPNQTGTTTQAISYCYDQINRVLGKAYAAVSCPLSSPAVSYSYDQGTNGIGHLTSLTDQAGSGSYSYDALGRTSTEQRTIAGIQKSLSYVYYLDGSVQTLTYPSGAVISYTPWNNGTNSVAGIAQSAVDTGNGINYAKGATYGADKSLSGFVSGSSNSFSGITTTFIYNNRLQPCRIMASGTGAIATNCTNSWGNVLDLNYDFHPGNGDNGNVYTITNYRDQSRNQTFTYDTLNRLTSAQNAGTDCTKMTENGKTEYWGNSYTYDAWGNLTTKAPTKCSAENLSVSVSNNNQLSGYSYDAAGNMTHDATTGNNYSYDSENRISSAAGYTYTYDADGNRVEKSNGSTGTIYWYMSPGVVAESDLNGNLKSEYVFFFGERIARRDLPGGAVSYYFSDHLQSASVITDSAGNIKAETDYYPFGGELQVTDKDPNRYKFTGKELDNETGLHNFGKRYYEDALSRFMTPDPLLNSGHPANPQSWNRYAYVLNNPLKFTDPTGLYEWQKKCKSGDAACQANRKKFRDALQKLREAAAKYKEGSPERKILDKILAKIGTEGDGNNVRVGFDSKMTDPGWTGPELKLGFIPTGNILMKFNFDAMDGPIAKAGYDQETIALSNAGLVGHEGQHASEGNAAAAKWLFSPSERFNWERRAINVESLVFEGFNKYEPQGPLWNPSWAPADRETLRGTAVDKLTHEMYDKKKQ